MIIDFLSKCLGSLPDSAAEYYSEYLSAAGNEEFLKKIELQVVLTILTFASG